MSRCSADAAGVREQRGNTTAEAACRRARRAGTIMRGRTGDAYTRRGGKKILQNDEVKTSLIIHAAGMFFACLLFQELPTFFSFRCYARSTPSPFRLCSLLTSPFQNFKAYFTEASDGRKAREAEPGMIVGFTIYPMTWARNDKGKRVKQRVEENIRT